MSNILTYELENAANFRRTILQSYKYDQAASYGAGLCERLAAANNNDPVAVSAYQRLEQNDSAKLKRATWGVMSSIGYGFTPLSPDEVLKAVVDRAAAA